MATPFAKSVSAAKRARSRDSLTKSPASSGRSTPATPQLAFSPPKRPREVTIPAFLQQTRNDIINTFNELNWQEKLRIVQGRTDPSSPWTQDWSPHILQRNRYYGLQPWDKSRIRLKVAQGLSDYINASPISLDDPASGQAVKFIATQGPMETGVRHFWRMVWQETADVAVIIMLTQTEEAGREKCFQYFPLSSETSPFDLSDDDESDEADSNTLSFVELESGHGPNTEVRKLELKYGTECKTIWHLWFMVFPDFGVPEDNERAELLDLLQLSRDKNSRDEDSPRIIHCSAGVGRSGTFIALEHLLAHLKHNQLVDLPKASDPIRDVVNRLRQQRMMMVQSESQYLFLYDIMGEQFRKQYDAYLAHRPSLKIRKIGDDGKSDSHATDSTVADTIASANGAVGGDGKRISATSPPATDAEV